MKRITKSVASYRLSRHPLSTLHSPLTTIFLLSAFLAGTVSAQAAGPHGVSVARGMKGKTAMIVVAGADAPSKIKKIADYVGSGTQASGGDGAVLQAAIDASRALYPSMPTVAISGTLYVEKASGTEWELSSCAFTNGTANVNTLVFATGSISDVQAGQMVRLWGGDDGGGNSLEDNHEEVVATVTAVGADNFTISESNPSASDYTGLKAIRMMPAVILKPGVHLTGLGPKTGMIKLANGQNCNILFFSNQNTTEYAGWYLSEITLDGNKTNQNGSGTAMDRRANGVLSTEYALDVYMTRATIVNCSGDACWLGHPWGNRVVGGWWEHCEGGGAYLTDGGGAYVGGLKINDNDGPALVLRRSDFNCIHGRVFGTNGEITHADSDTYNRDEYSIKIIGSELNEISGTEIRGYNTDQEGALYLGKANQNAISGCLFYCNGVSGKEAVTFGTATCLDNTITGNVFDCHVDSGITGADTWANHCNVVTNNSRARRYDDELVCVLMKNVSGGALSRRSVVVKTTDGFTTSTTVGDSRVIGQTDYESSIANGEYGHVQTRGYTQYLTVGDSDGENIASGDELCIGDTAGWAAEAGSGHTVFAIAKGTKVVGAGVSGMVKALLVEPYVKP